ncbi:MAG: tRNA 2-thiocytidine biosynthesis protein TtcA [Myxococcota bacterium]|nr:tRNA 2-thiocytidine biosynthesis protein TtcA [Myxococcota bacterium]
MDMSESPARMEGAAVSANPFVILSAAEGKTCGSCSSVRAPVVPLRTGTDLEHHLTRLTGRAIADFGMINEGDHVMVAVSGGKDSYALLHILRLLQSRAPIRFRLTAVNIDQGYAGYNHALIEEYLRINGYTFHMDRTETYNIVSAKKDPDAGWCSFCARIRRGKLYALAGQLGCNKIALGHHLDDFIETALLNQMFAGKLKAMPARLVSDDGHNIVIRPLVYALEKDIRAFAQETGFPVVCCNCPACGQEDHQKRQMVKRLLNDLERENPGVKHSMFSALCNIEPSHLLDRKFLTPSADATGEQSKRAA